MESWRDLIVWAFVLGLTGGMIWLGYQLIIRTRGIGRSDEPTTPCHLCGRPFPTSELVAREKMAGFVNYFCAECIASLSRESAAGPGQNGVTRTTEGIL